MNSIKILEEKILNKKQTPWKKHLEENEILNRNISLSIT